MILIFLLLLGLFIGVLHAESVEKLDRRREQNSPCYRCDKPKSKGMCLGCMSYFVNKGL